MPGSTVYRSDGGGGFESRDLGATWSVFGTGLPNAIAADLVLHPASRILRVGTRDRGVWEAGVDG